MARALAAAGGDAAGEREAARLLCCAAQQGDAAARAALHAHAARGLGAARGVLRRLRLPVPQSDAERALEAAARAVRKAGVCPLGGAAARAAALAAAARSPLEALRAAAPLGDLVARYEFGDAAPCRSRPRGRTRGSRARPRAASRPRRRTSAR